MINPLQDQHLEVGMQRLLIVMVGFILAFSIIVFRLCDIVLFSSGSTYTPYRPVVRDIFERGDIIDRNGVLLAVNLATASLYANPKIILDAKEAAEKLHRALPELPYKQLLQDLKSQKTFVWIKRNLTPKEQYAVNNLGIPGLFFERGEKRVYPHGALLSHVLGYVGIDGRGLAGIEKQFDQRLSLDPKEGTVHPEPLQLSIDVRVQNIMHEELRNAMQEFRALGAVGIVGDANTGEVLALVSLPDFDPHNPGSASVEQRFNRASLGVYEMGSSFKTFTMAMALDSKKVSVQDSFDVNAPIRVARFSISDYHGRGGWLSVPEIFMYSSNIGTAKIGMQVGRKKQQEFLKRCHLLNTLEIELPEKALPIYPPLQRWTDINMLTISYGHGIAVTPLHVVKAMSAIVNGGVLYPQTLLKQELSATLKGERIIQEETSEMMRRLLRLVVEQGTGGRAKAPGYVVGGKTGTAEKLTHSGGYSHSANLSSFIGAFPMHNPKYTILVILDEPKGTKATSGYATGGMTAAPIVGKVISRLGSILSLPPVNEEDEFIRKRISLDYKKSGENL